MQDVDSELFKQVGYKDGKLSVKFNDGDVYHYHNVPEDKYSEMLSSKSMGKYFIRNIRGKHKHDQE